MSKIFQVVLSSALPVPNIAVCISYIWAVYIYDQVWLISKFMCIFHYQLIPAVINTDLLSIVIRLNFTGANRENNALYSLNNHVHHHGWPWAVQLKIYHGSGWNKVLWQLFQKSAIIWAWGKLTQGVDGELEKMNSSYWVHVKVQPIGKTPRYSPHDSGDDAILQVRGEFCWILRLHHFHCLLVQMVWDIFGHKVQPCHLMCAVECGISGMAVLQVKSEEKKVVICWDPSLACPFAISQPCYGRILEP